MKKIIATAILLSLSVAAFACTSVIIPGKYTANGKPLMLKVRDQSIEKQNTNVQYFKGAKYDYLGLVGDASRKHSRITGIVGGMNTEGFCTMSLTSHSFENNPLADSTVRKPSLQMEALGCCRTVEEFDDYLLNKRGKPVANVSNLGVIDAHGGAAYYEFNGYDWTKYDVTDPAVAPDGYMVMTNFSWSGDAKGSGGWDRYFSADAIMKQFKKNDKGLYDMTVEELYNAFVRSYHHEVEGVGSLDDLSNFKYCHDGGMICSNKTCGVITFEGVPVGTSPKYTVMWSHIGYPVTTVAIPLLVGKGNMVPEYIWKEGEKQARIFAKSYELRDKLIYDNDWSGRFNYFNVANVKKCIYVMRDVEKYISDDFYGIFDKWYAGKIKDAEFYGTYSAHLPQYYQKFLEAVD